MKLPIIFLPLPSIDINECNKGTHDCDANADCQNTGGSFTCTCRFGYSGSGKDGNCKGKLMRIVGSVIFFPLRLQSQVGDG